MANGPAPKPLEYASPRTAGVVSPTSLREGLVLGGLGVAANVLLAGVGILNIRRSLGVHAALLRNPSAYGRPVPADAIAKLEYPIELWTSQALLLLAAMIGLSLALLLIVSISRANTNWQRSEQHLRRYAKWTPYAALFTATTYFWAVTAHLDFWIMATRHHPLGSGPPVFSTLILLLAALYPARWLRRTLLA